MVEFQSSEPDEYDVPAIEPDVERVYADEIENLETVDNISGGYNEEIDALVGDEADTVPPLNIAEEAEKPIASDGALETNANMAA